MTSIKETLRNVLGIVAAIYLITRVLDIRSLADGERLSYENYPSTSYLSSNNSLHAEGVPVYEYVPLARPVSSIEEHENGATEMLLIKAWVAGQSTLNFTFPILKTSTPKSRYFLTADVRIQAKNPVATVPPQCLGSNQSAPVCEIRLGATINGVGRIVGFAGQITAKDKYCLVRYSFPQGVEATVLDFVEYPYYKYATAKGVAPNPTLVISWDILGFTNVSLDDWEITVLTTLTHVPSPFKRWDDSGISNGMVKCAYFELSRTTYLIGLLQISNNGNNVRIVHSIDVWKSDNSSSTPHRLLAIERGIRQTIQYAKTSLQIGTFPDIEAIIWPGDDAKLPKVVYEILQSNCVSMGLPVPPILAQNRLYRADAFVLMPDFSYFSDFLSGHDHGSPDDEWFRVLDSESRLTANTPTPFYAQPFHDKIDQAVFRGKAYHRQYGYLREALWTDPKCRNNRKATNSSGNRPLAAALPFLNSSSYSFNNFIKRDIMCKDFSVMLTLPGNGVWSWASKFNLVSFSCVICPVICYVVVVQLCNSVSLLVAPNELHGESWEVRANLGLRPWVHYIPITSNNSKICENIEDTVDWVRHNKNAAKKIADRGRQFALGIMRVLRSFFVFVVYRFACQ
jgi:hypothetical protein